MLRQIRLYGTLGQQFGKVHYLAVDSAAEAIRALCVNFKDFERYLVESKQGFKVWVGATGIKEVGDIHGPSGAKETIRIAPQVSGAGKSPWVGILVGAVLVASAFATGGATLASTGMFGFGTTLTTTFLGSAALKIGTGLILGGVAQLLSEPPKQEAAADAENQPSYNFNGAINTTAQGNPVPVGYGRMIVGSAVISAGLSATDIAAGVRVPSTGGYSKVDGDWNIPE